MNNEIKGILEALENTIKDDRIPYEIESFECKTLLDYITNLQEENQRLKENNQNMQVEMSRSWERIDKAIEALKILKGENND